MESPCVRRKKRGSKARKLPRYPKPLHAEVSTKPGATKCHIGRHTYGSIVGSSGAMNYRTSKLSRLP